LKRRKRKLKKVVKISIIILIFIIILIVGGNYILNMKNNSYIKFNNLDLEVNSSVYLYDLIKNIDELEINTDNYLIDTSSIGKQKIDINFTIENKNIDHNFTINIIDTTKPTLDFTPEVVINLGDNVDLLKSVSTTDNSLTDVSIDILGKYDLNSPGTYKLEYQATDKSGNKTIEKFTLTVVELAKAPKNYEEFKVLDDGKYTTSNGYTLTIKDGIAYVEDFLIANKTYRLPSDYVPLNPYAGSILSNNCNTCIDYDTMNAFKEMEADARSIGLNLYISSGYRSFNVQKNLYNNYVARDGKTAADTYSARSGHSEHQTGYCFDLNTIDDSFAYTDEGKWVNENAWKYGLIIRYPKDKEHITGYQYESWHLRYVGTDLAKKLYNDGSWITLEEYYGLTSDYGE